jgi:hypothetical protein
MVIPARAASPKANLRCSSQRLVTIFVGACLLALTFLSGFFYSESLHDDYPLESNLRGAATLKTSVLPGGTYVLPDESTASDHPEEGEKEYSSSDPDKDSSTQKNKHNEKKWGNTMKRPDDWVKWSFHDVHSEFECSKHAHDQKKPLPDLKFWEFYRDIYKQVVNSEIEFDPVPPTEGYTMNNKGGKQPYYAKISPGKGRGLFASRDIKEGELVHDGNVSDIEMSANEWRSMVFSLPRKMACDLSEWTWTQQTKKGGPYKIFTAFNISILMNDSENPNTQPKSTYSSRMYALRDIKKDEEILTDYTIYPTKWDKVGLA